MNFSIDEMNEKLYMAAEHLVQAGKHISDIDKDTGVKMMLMADKILENIKVPKQKVSDEKMESILNKILKGEDEL